MPSMNLVRVSEGLIFFLLGGLVFSLPAFAYDRPCVPMSKSYDLIFQGRLGLRYELVQTDASTLGLQWRKWSLTDYYSGNPKLDLMCSMYPGSYARSEVISFYDTKIWKGDHRPEGPYNAIKIMGETKPRSGSLNLMTLTWFMHLRRRMAPTTLSAAAQPSLQKERGIRLRPLEIQSMRKRALTTNMTTQDWCIEIGLRRMDTPLIHPIGGTMWINIDPLASLEDHAPIQYPLMWCSSVILVMLS